MKNRAPAFQFYPRQFAGDDQVMGMDLEAIGAHILLMCAAAASPEGCRIEADEYAVRMRLRNPPDEDWQRIKKQLLAGAWKVSDDGNWWIQSGLERTFKKQKEFSDLQSQRARRGRSRNDAEVKPDASRNDAGGVPDHMPEVCSSSSFASANLNPKGSNPNECRSDAGSTPDGFNSMSVAQIICQQNGWSGRQLLWSVKEAIDFQANRMPEVELEAVGEWLLKAYAHYKSAKGTFAVLPQKFFEQGLYAQASDRKDAKSNVLKDNPATRALAQMEAS